MTNSGFLYTFAPILNDNGGPTSLNMIGRTATTGFQLNGANTYSGMTTLTGGYLVLNNASALPNYSNLKLGGILELTATSGTRFLLRHRHRGRAGAVQR